MQETGRILENRLIVDAVTQKEVAKEVGCSEATITNLIQGKEIKFSTIHLISSARFEGDSEFIRRACCESVKVENVKCAMEFLYANHYFTELQFICDKFRLDKPFSEWVIGYEVALAYQSNRDNYEELLITIEEVSPTIKDCHVKLLLQILKANILARSREFKPMMRIVSLISDQINNIKNLYIKDSYLCRIEEIKAHAYLFCKADMESARKSANYIISKNICAKLVSDASYIVGTSYLFTDKDKSLSAFELSCELLIKMGRKELAVDMQKRDISFLKTYWGDETNEHYSEPEKAYALARQGKSIEAVEILDKLSGSPFRTYYRAIAEKNDMLHFKALSEFIARNDFFYAQLPAQELMDKPQYREIVNNLLQKGDV